MVALNRVDFSILREGEHASSDNDPSGLHHLSEQQQQRLTEQLDLYLVSLENGEPLDPAEITRQHPDIAEIFRSYLDKLHVLYGVVSEVAETAGQPAQTVFKRLGDFQIGNVIGRGGMGVVYEAIQISLGRRVALKLLPMASMLDSTQIARFQNEAHAAGLLQHPSVVPVYSVGSDRGIHYYAMQYIDGVSMDAWISDVAQHQSNAGQSDAKSNSELPPWQTLVGWAADIADALHSAHEAGVIHRDVKPSNLMLDSSKKIWITDFGLARCQSDMSLTGSGDMLGTIRYMSPEQAAGKSAIVDGRCDIYALAATLYEMLALRPALVGDSAAEILTRIDRDEITSLRRIRSDLPRDLETVICKAMSKNRDQRYETAADMANDLRRVIHDQPTIARPPSFVDHCFRFASKHRTIVMLTSLFLVVGIIGMSIATATFATLKQNAETNAARRLESESLAREAVDRLGSRAAEALADIPAAGTVRRRLLTETLEYYQTFAAAADHDPALGEDVAITYGKIGTFQSELGQHQQAIESLLQSERLFAKMAQSDANNDRLQLDWSTSQNNLAQSLVRKGEFEQAASYFAKAIVTQRGLSQRAINAENNLIVSAPDVGTALATTLNNLGLLLAETGAIDQAERTYLEAIEILECVGEEGGVSDSRTPTLAKTLTNLSALLAEQDPERAVEYARQALIGQTDALQNDPGDTKLATQVTATLNTLGAALARDNQLDASVDIFNRAIEVGEQLLQRWPDQPTYRRDLVISLNHLGLSLSRAGRLLEARSAFEKALTHESSLALSFANDAETQSMLGGVLNNLGFLQQKLGERDAAAKSFRNAIQAQTIAVGLAPDVERYREYLQKHQSNFRAATQKGDAS